MIKYSERNFLSSNQFKEYMIDDCIKRGKKFNIQPWELTRCRIGIKRFVKLLEETYDAHLIWMYDNKLDVYILEWL